jgi:biopolymer transport protein ExbB
MRHRFLSSWLGAIVCSFGLLALTLGTFSMLAVLDTRVGWAQEKAKEPPKEEAVDEELPPADPPAEKAAPAASAPAADTLDPTSVAAQDTLLGFTYRSLGLRYTVAFLAISFTFVALVVMNILAARRDNVVPLALVEGFEQHLNEKRYQEAYELAKNDESFLGQVLSAGLAKLSTGGGYAQAIEAMQEVGEEENMKVEHRLSHIALIGTISPMVGLLGTVDGMVQSFRVIATSSTQPKPSELADGISMALVTTLIGLVIAIPAIAFFNLMRNRMARLVLEVGIVSEGLMNRFSTIGTKKS